MVWWRGGAVVRDRGKILDEEAVQCGTYTREDLVDVEYPLAVWNFTAVSVRIQAPGFHMPQEAPYVAA